MDKHRCSNGYGYGYGSGSGCGEGDGVGYGEGNGDGYGYGCGSGRGRGHGDGDGTGHGWGKGYGWGWGSGDGWGCGWGSGYGDEHLDCSKWPQRLGDKNDNGKLQLDLIPPEVIEMLGEIYTYGADKYGRGNWEKGFEDGRLIAAARRHDLALAKGEVLDPESGLPHAAHAAWNYLTIETLRKREGGQNDL